MLRRLDALFDPTRPRVGSSLWALVVSDYVAFYSTTPQRLRSGVSGSLRNDSPRRLWLLFVPRMINNPCLHAVVLIRLALGTPSFLLGFWRGLLIAKHTIDVHLNTTIGPGLVLPHPHSITLGWGLTAGPNLTILHNVTLGGQVQHGVAARSPTIGENVVIYTGVHVLGDLTVGDGAVLGAGAFVVGDVPAGVVVKRGAGA